MYQFYKMLLKFVLMLHIETLLKQWIMLRDACQTYVE